MTTQATCYVKDLSSSDAELLAQLLSFNPGYPINTDGSWLHDQAHLISTFPPNLLVPRNLLRRFNLSRPFGPPKAKLCSAHKKLNPHLAHQMFLGISAECTTYLERFLEDDSQLPESLRALLINLQPLIRRLQAVNGLWMTSNFYRTLFFPWHATPTDFCFERIDSGCEACILASVGGNHQVLSDLRASIRGRKKKGRSHAPILKMVEAWIDWTGHGDTIREESSRLGKEIAKCRREMQKARRLKHGVIAEGSLHYDSAAVSERGALSEQGDQVNEEDGGQDFEGSIIDFYAKRLSTASPMNRVRTMEGLHEAFRESIVHDPVTGAYHRSRTEGVRPYSPSVLSNKATSFFDHIKSSEQFAKSYQNLLEIPEDEVAGWNTESTDLQVEEPSFM